MHAIRGAKWKKQVAYEPRKKQRRYFVFVPDLAFREEAKEPCTREWYKFKFNTTQLNSTLPYIPCLDVKQRGASMATKEDQVIYIHCEVTIGLIT